MTGVTSGTEVSKAATNVSEAVDDALPGELLERARVVGRSATPEQRRQQGVT